MDKSAVLVAAMMLSMVAGCVSSEPRLVVSESGEGRGSGDFVRYHEEIRSPAGFGLQGGVDCNGR